MFVDMFYTSFFGMPNPDPVMRRNMICSNPGAFNAFKMQRLMDMPTFKSFLMSKYTKQEIWNALPNPFDLITNLISYPNMALRLLSSSQYYVIMQTFNAMTNTDFLTCFYQFRPQNYFSYVYSLGQLGSIFAKGYPIMTFMSDFARNNPSQIEALWNAMLGSYGQYYSSFKLSELDLYGAKRLGNIQDTLKLNSFYFNGSYNAASNSYNISSTFAPTYGASVNYYLTSFTYGKKQYEITNHLGNVLSTVADYKLPYLNSSGKLCYYPDVRSENKYYAFGGAKDGNWSVNNYSYGYQGSLKNNGLDGTINTFYRQGDVEGLFWTSVDPKFYLTPWESPYSLMGGNPVVNTDVLGDIIGQRREKVDYGEEFTVADFGYRAFNDVKHSIENLALTFRKADPGMKWKADYIRDEFGQETYGGTVIKQVPSEGKIIDIVEKAFDVLTVVSVGSFNGKDLILAAKTAAKPSVVKAIGQVIKSNFIHGKTSHMNVLEEVAKKYADNGGIAFIHKALNTALGKKIQSIGRLLPDVTVIKSDGSIHLLEMQSPGQSLDKLRRKLRIMASELNKEGYKVTTELRDVNGKVVK